MTRRLPALSLLALGGLLLATPAPACARVSGRGAQPALYASNWQGSLGLVRVDRNTLRPLTEPRVPLAGEPLGWSFAPDRSRLAIGSTQRGAKLRLIDLRAMRALGDVRVARRGSGVATTWTGPTRVLAVVVTPGCCGAGDTIVAAVDAARRRVIWRKKLGGSLQAGERLRRGLLLVLGPRRRSVGPSRVVRVGSRGDIRSEPLPEILSGIAPSRSATQVWDPGLAVDSSRRRAFVVQAQAPLAEVDVRTLQVRWHPLEPLTGAADGMVGPTRHALWLGHGLLAVTGVDSRFSPGDHAHGVRGWQTPAGLTLVDTRRWRARTIDPRTTDAQLVAGTVLASSFLVDSPVRAGRGSGLTGYSIEGRRKFHLFGKAPLTGVQPLGSRALVGALRASVLIDARTGRRLRRYRRFTMGLIGRDAPFY
jgi:hypothetical protein